MRRYSFKNKVKYIVYDAYVLNGPEKKGEFLTQEEAELFCLGLLNYSSGIDVSRYYIQKHEYLGVE